MKPKIAKRILVRNAHKLIVAEMTSKEYRTSVQKQLLKKSKEARRVLKLDSKKKGDKK